MTRNVPSYEKLFNGGIFKGTLMIGPDPLGANYDYSVFLGVRLKLRDLGLKLINSKRGYEEYQTVFNNRNRNIIARIRLVHGRNYNGNLQELWKKTLAGEDLIYLKSHAGYGKHLSLSDDVSYFTDDMKKGFHLPDRNPYQLYYLDCCKSEMYYMDAFRDYVGSNGVDLILHKWFCDYKKTGPVVVLIRELMKGSDFETIVAEMNDEYGIPHFDVEDDPEDLRLDRKMVTYSISQE